MYVCVCVLVEMAEDSENKDIGALIQRVRELEKELAALKEVGSGEAVRRSKIDKMSSEVVDSNPYRYWDCVSGRHRGRL